MSIFFKKLLLSFIILLLLNACISTGKESFSSLKGKILNSEGDANDVGLSLKEDSIKNDIGKVDKNAYVHRKLNIIIPAFDPGIIDNKETFSELRNFESRRFAVKLKLALENTDKVGAVRVTPNTSVSGEIYIIGKIQESNGQKIKVSIKVVDATGKKIMDKSFSKKIKANHYSNIRTKTQDAYNKFFDDIAKKIVIKLEKLKPETVLRITRINDLRFGAEFSPESFRPYLKKKKNNYDLIGLPSDNDPMWERVKSIKVREQIFIDSLQNHYDKFVNSSNQSYILWQGQSYNEIVAAKQARNKAIGRGVLGVLSIAAAVASASSAQDNDYTNEVAIATLGGKLLEDAAKFKAEAKMHRDSIKELGESLDAELAPNVVEFETKTVELTGNAKQQFLEWRKFLKKIYELEKTPDIQL